jgi:DNA-3-methyladenine glycosylase II
MAAGFGGEQSSRILARRDPIFKKLVKQIGPCTLKPATSREPYEALVRSIAFQQLNTAVATKILGRFVDLFPDEKFPSAQSVLRVSADAMRAAGLSQNKILAIKDIARFAADGQVPTRRQALRLSDEELIERLVAIRGVGRWTVEMLLISTLGRPDILPVDDYGVRMGYKMAAGLDDLPKPKELAAIGEAWEGHRTAASWYFWRMVDLSKLAKAK